MQRLIPLLLIMVLWPSFASALVSEGRPGVPYFSHVLFLQQKVMAGDEVKAVSLAYSDPRADNRDLCQNSIDVFGGLELFRDIPERRWVLVDYEMQSILVAEGFLGDADVFAVTACPDVEQCLAWSDQRNADPAELQRRAERPRAATTRPATLSELQAGLVAGRSLVKSARCRGCHSIEGVGPQHAPSLSWKRIKYEPGWLDAYLAAPWRMRPAMSNLMMPRYTSPNAAPSLQPAEVRAVANYLANVATASAPDERFQEELWPGYDCYGCHTRLYREKPLEFVPTPVPADLAAAVKSAPAMQICLGCHPFGDLRTVEPLPAGAPNAFASDLLLSFEKLSINYLSAFLENPAYVEPQTRMPDLGLDAANIDQVRDIARRVKESIADGTLKPVHTPYAIEKRAQEPTREP